MGVSKATYLTVGDAEVARPHDIENKTREIDFSGKFSNNSKLQNTCNEYETPTSICQNEELIVPEKTRIDSLYLLFLVKFEKFYTIWRKYEKPNVANQFPFNDDLFNITTKEKKTKRQKSKY